jgi:ubiquinone/menaquinone biosynthesis C-methylase UbiE
MSRLTQWMDRTFYAGYSDKWDDKLFRDKVIAVLKPEFSILDLGAGRGTRGELDFRQHCRHVAGADVDPAVLENPYLHEARLQQAPEFLIPFADQEFDLVFSNSVLEHVATPDTFFREVYRVLKPGGMFMAKTPNKYHYIPWIATCTPEWFHRYYNQLRGRSGEDTFPTVYRCNCEKDARRLANAQGFEVKAVELVEGRPEYLRLAAPAYLAGMIVERTVNATDALRHFRCVMYLQLLKLR